MATKKKPWHKRQIHHNRYLIWTLVIGFIMAGLLVFYAYLTRLNIDQNVSIEDTDYWHTYRTAGFSVKYPFTWLVDAEPNAVSFGPANQDAFLVYTFASNDAAYSSYQENPTTQQITVDGRNGIEVYDNTVNPPFKIVLVKTNGMLYEFRGSTPLFNRIVGTVRFNN